MKVGDIYLVNLDPTIGDEKKKCRPVIILNPGDINNLQLSVVVPITEWKKYWERNPFFVILKSNKINGLGKKSAVDCFQIRTISHKRFIKKLGMITEKEIEDIKSAISLVLDITPENCY